MNISYNNYHEINEQELQAVNGGAVLIVVEPEAPGGRYIYIHKTCGGVIENVNNPFKMCRCKKCGEEHYSCFSFDYHEYEKRLRRPES